MKRLKEGEQLVLSERARMVRVENVRTRRSEFKEREARGVGSAGQEQLKEQPQAGVPIQKGCEHYSLAWYTTNNQVGKVVTSNHGRSK